MKYRIGEKGNPVKDKKAAGILFTNGSHVLLLKRAKGNHEGTWDFPGGGAKDKETPIGNAIRETKEETGLKKIPGYRLDSFISTNGKKIFTTFLYRVNCCFEVNLDKEHTSWEWVPIENVETKNLHPKLADNWDRYLQAIHRKIGKFSDFFKNTSDGG